VSFAGNDPFPVGARTLSLGGAYSGVRGDFWSLFNNPAGISGMSHGEVGVYVERRFMLKELTYGSAGFAMPFKDIHAAGIEVGTFGFDSYRETRIGLNYAATIMDVVSLGAKVNYAILSIEGFGSTSAVYVDVGVNTQVSKTVSLGFSALNVNRAKLVTSGEVEDRIPTVLTAGVAYKPSDKVLLLVDVQKDIAHPVTFMGGVEYEFIDGFMARVGGSAKPRMISGGLGMNLKGIKFDFAATYHQQLGFTPHIGLSYNFGKGVKLANMPVLEDH